MSQSGPSSGRRTPARGPRTTRRPGSERRTRPARPSASPARPTSTKAGKPGKAAKTAKAGSGRPEARPRPRLTSRAAILVLIVAVLAVSYASSLRAYLQQRDHLNEVQDRIASSEAAIADLEREKRQFDDPAYIEQQARGLGYLMPGESPFVVLRDGKPVDVSSSLGDPAAIDPSEPEAWWDGAWESMKVAGHPPRKTDPPPLTRVEDPEGAPSEDGS
ncbi:septum formation initiator family protein [Nocardioides sp. GXZ039]|uniref:septum formation initiator family protein n=1 Tax=Nocardioides sp. GXZ039 TaxID=3136018 RepID=UPI0030F38D7C